MKLLRVAFVVLSACVCVSAQPVSGWTARWRANTSAKLFHVIGPPPSSVVTNGQAVAAWENDQQATPDLIWVQNSGANQSTWLSSGINSLGSLNFSGGSIPWLSLNVAAENATQPWSTLVANNAATIFAAVQLNGDCAAHQTNQYLDNELFGDSAGGYLQIGCETSSAGTAKIFAGGFDSGFKYTSTSAFVSITTESSPHILMLQHTSSGASTGTLTIALDCATSGANFQTITMGNMGSVASFVDLGKNYTSTNYWPGYLGEIIFYNTALSAGNIATTCTYMQNTWTGAAAPATMPPSVY